MDANFDLQPKEWTQLRAWKAFQNFEQRCINSGWTSGRSCKRRQEQLMVRPKRKQSQHIGMLGVEDFVLCGT